MSAAPDDWAGRVSCFARSSTNVRAHAPASHFIARRRIARIRSRRSPTGRSSASRSEPATAWMSYGLTISALNSSSAAPANSLSTSTPAGSPTSSRWHATYSLATRFIPSISGVTMPTSASE
jgi:hypothetical protein